jgi:hypothetical protein
MSRVDGSLARSLDFGGNGGSHAASTSSSGRVGLRIARPTRLAGPDKYKVLDARRRRAQIKARRLLDLMDAAEIGK